MMMPIEDVPFQVNVSPFHMKHFSNSASFCCLAWCLIEKQHDFRTFPLCES
eukprot:TRINITY_DN97_c0_g1_i2.p4 TRINITY_DN97_c0_g1~~TRINITY_DN97_c0_g1_i2.p4  ORF type:complete len:51 (+),score=8.49 TRINITY_DN97_c0_g1_i2:175-327(+)